MLAATLFAFASATSNAIANTNVQTPAACYDKHNGVMLRPGSTYIMQTSWYGSSVHQGNPMANGEPFDRNDPTLTAHKVLPLGTQIRITHPETGVVRYAEITDDGPHPAGRDLDASRALATDLDLIEPGHAPLEVTILRFGNSECRDDGKGLR